MLLFPKVIRFNAVPVAITLLRKKGEEDALQRQRDIENAREEGRRQGNQEAMAALNLQILQQRTEMAHLQENTFHKIAEQHDALVEELKKAVPSLVLEVSKRVLAGVEISPEMVKAIAYETLSELAPGTPDVELKFAPQDIAIIEKLMEEFGHKYPGIKIISSPNLQSGDCIAHSHFGSIDSRLSVKMENITRALQ